MSSSARTSSNDRWTWLWLSEGILSALSPARAPRGLPITISTRVGEPKKACHTDSTGEKFHAQNQIPAIARARNSAKPETKPQIRSQGRGCNAYAGDPGGE